MRAGNVEFILVALGEHAARLNHDVFDLIKIRLEINRSVCIADSAFARIERIKSVFVIACEEQCAGAVQVDVALMCLQCISSAWDIQIAVSGDRQVFLCKDRSSTQCTGSLGNRIVADQMNSQCILRNNRRRCAERKSGKCV